MAKKLLPPDELVTKVSVRVTPRASTNTVTAYVDGVAQIRLTAPPVEGAANESCCVFVAGVLGIAKSQVSVSGGAHNRNKVLAIRGLSSEEIATRFVAAVRPASP